MEPVYERSPGIIFLESSVCDNQKSGVSTLGEIQESEIPSEAGLDWQIPNPSTVEDWKNCLYFGYQLAKELDLLK